MQVHAAQPGRSGIARGYVQEPGKQQEQGKEDSVSDTSAAQEVATTSVDMKKENEAPVAVVREAGTETDEDEEQDEEVGVGQKMEDFIDAFDTSDEDDD